MTRLTTLTPETVYSRCDELKNAGISPTVRILKAELGGATATLALYLRQWREKSTHVLQAIEISTELKIALNSHIQKEISKAIENLKTSLQCSEEDCKVLGETLASKEVLISELEAEKKDLEQQLLKTSTEIALLRKLIEASETKKAQLQEQQLIAEKSASHASGRLEEMLRAQKIKKSEDISLESK